MGNTHFYFLLPRGVLVQAFAGQIALDVNMSYIRYNIYEFGAMGKVEKSRWR